MYSFEDAINMIKSQYPNSTLVIPKGRFLTAPFNLTSHMTLHLEKGAKIIGTKKISLWPIIPFLPSYGRGRDHPGPRFLKDFIFYFILMFFSLFNYLNVYIC